MVGCGLHGLEADLTWIVRGQTAVGRGPHRHCFGSSHPAHPLRKLGGENMAALFENTMLVLYLLGWAYLLPSHNFRNMLGCYHGVETIQ